MAVEHQEISCRNLRLPIVVTGQTVVTKSLQQSRNKPAILQFQSNHAPPGVSIQVNERPGLATQTEIVRQNGI